MTEGELKEVLELEEKVKQLNKAGEYKKKVNYCEMGLLLDPNNIYFLSSLGFYYYHTEVDYEKALKYFRKCLDLGDRLEPLKESYFKCLIHTNKVPDLFDVKMLKEHFDVYGIYKDYHLFLIKRILENYSMIDPDLAMFYMIDKLRRKNFEGIEKECDEFIKKIPNNSVGLRSLEYMITIMRMTNNLEKSQEYIECYKNWVYQNPERITEKRLNNIKNFNSFLKKNACI